MTVDSARRATLAVAVVTLTITTASAQVDERFKALEQQIDRIYATNDYALPRFGPARWLGDGEAYTTVERNTGAAGGSDIVRYDATTGARSILISNTQLIPAGKDRALEYRRLRVVGRRLEVVDLHQHAEGVAAKHARRLLGVLHRRSKNSSRKVRR